MKRWIIPDIHGYLKTLQALFDYYISPSKEDELYFLGDYIDRGPDSKGVIDFIMGLEAEGFNVCHLKGNHEESCVQACLEEQHVGSFLGIRGRFRIEFADRVVEIGPGEMIIVPRGVEHRTAADEEAEVLVFEPASTLNTGNVEHPDLTAPNDVAI